MTDQYEVPADLKGAGDALWCGVVAGRTLNAANLVLLHNACRIADRLDDIAAELVDSPLTVTLLDRRGEPVNEVAQPLLGEHRQQLATLNTILARMGFGELAPASDGRKPWMQVVADEVAKKRAEKSG